MLTSALFVSCFTLTVSAQQKYRLRYKFDKGEKLQYKTERHDSTETEQGGQPSVQQITVWAVQTLSVDDANDQAFKITLKTDTTWSDQDDAAAEGSGPGRGRRFRGMRGPRERSYEISPIGRAVSGEDPLSPVLIILPENEIGINENWNFEVTTEQMGRRQGRTTVMGQCLLYDVQEENGRRLAVIIVSIESQSEGQFQFQPQGREPVSGTFASNSTGTNLVYFDIDRGRIVEVVSEETRESNTESTMSSRRTLSKSNSTVTLVSE
jgi:hypothetical protein